MIRNESTRIAFVAALVAALVAGASAAVVAQADPPTSPEGTDWTLIRYYDEASAETVSVPFEIQPTLRLEDGAGGGFGGCDRFSGGYGIDGSSLIFSEEISVTLADCDGPGQVIEDAYLSALGGVASWTIDGDVLELSDGIGDIVLTFERPTILWTPSQLAGLMASLSEVQTGLAELRTEMGALREDLDAVPVKNFRERIKTLESDNRKLTRRLKDVENAPTLDPTPRPDANQGSGGSSFTAAERVLLEGIPQRIANKCRPLRSSLPRATRAAVTCKPNTSAVSSMDYYLLEGQAAATAFGADMDAHKVNEATSAKKTCVQGTKSQRHWLTNGWQAEGCYRADNTAEVRFIDNATDCRKLKVGGKTLARPAFYVALQGSNKDIARVHAWATKNLPADGRQLTSVTQPIPSKAGVSPTCPT